MFKFNGNKVQNRIDTLIGADASIQGDVKFKGGLRVDGSIKGNITEDSTATGALVLSESAIVEGAVTVSRVVVNGKVIGPLKSSEYLELQSKSRISGDVYYKSLEMHTGAVVEGKLIHMGDDFKPPLQTSLAVDKD